MIDARLLGADLGTSLTVALLALSVWFATEVAARRLLPRLDHHGILPEVTRAVRASGRVGTPPLVILALGALLPPGLQLVAPLAAGVLLLATAVAGRGVMVDVAAGAVVAAEGRVRTGARVSLDGRRGIVTARGLRVTEVELDDGALLELPNRRLLWGRVEVDPDTWAPVDVFLAAPPGRPAASIRPLIEELALISPYLAPSRPPQVNRDPDRPDVWRVEARLVHPRYASAFKSALVEQFEEQTSVPGRERSSHPTELTVVPPTADGRDQGR